MCVYDNISALALYGLCVKVKRDDIMFWFHRKSRIFIFCSRLQPQCIFIKSLHREVSRKPENVSGELYNYDAI